MWLSMHWVVLILAGQRRWLGRGHRRFRSGHPHTACSCTLAQPLTGRSGASYVLATFQQTGAGRAWRPSWLRCVRARVSGSGGLARQSLVDGGLGAGRHHRLRRHPRHRDARRPSTLLEHLPARPDRQPHRRDTTHPRHGHPDPHLQLPARRPAPATRAAAGHRHRRAADLRL